VNVVRLLCMSLAPVALLACGGPVYFGDAVPYPKGCGSFGRTIDQCTALVDRAQGELGLHASTIISIDILTEDRCEADRSVLCNRAGTAVPLSVRFVMTDGSSEWTTVYCLANFGRPDC
jgi:hypothetical protein